MVLAINTERSSKLCSLQGIPDRTWCLSWLFHSRLQATQMLFDFHAFRFLPAWQLSGFLLTRPPIAFLAAEIWGLPHCCPLFGFPSRSRRRGAPTTEPLGPPHDNLGLPSWSWPSTRNGPLDATPALSPKSSTAPATATL